MNLECCFLVNSENKDIKMSEKFKTFNSFKIGDVKESEELEIEIGSSNTIIQPFSLPAEIVSALEKNLGHEYNAHYTYRNAANWCRNANYKKATAYFEAEAASELDHAKGIQDYLTQWNVIPQIPEIDPAIEFGSLVDIINKGYEIEYKLLLSYSKLQSSLIVEHPATFNFIQKYVDIQNDSVAEYSDLLNALCLINPDNKLDVLVFEERYF